MHTISCDFGDWVKLIESDKNEQEISETSKVQYQTEANALRLRSNTLDVKIIISGQHNNLWCTSSILCNLSQRRPCFFLKIETDVKID